MCLALFTSGTKRGSSLSNSASLRCELHQDQPGSLRSDSCIISRPSSSDLREQSRLFSAMAFFRSSQPATSSSSSRPVSLLGASRYEQPYTPNVAHRRSPPHREPGGPKNLHDLARLGQGQDNKTGGLIRHRPQASVGPKRPHTKLHSPDIRVSSMCDGPDFSSKPTRLDELDAYGSYARPTTSQARVSTLSAARTVLRSGPHRHVQVVDTSIVEKLLPGYPRDGKRNSSGQHISR